MLSIKNNLCAKFVPPVTLLKSEVILIKMSTFWSYLKFDNDATCDYVINLRQNLKEIFMAAYAHAEFEIYTTFSLEVKLWERDIVSFA